MGDILITSVSYILLGHRLIENDLIRIFSDVLLKAKGQRNSSLI